MAFFDKPAYEENNFAIDILGLNKSYKSVRGDEKIFDQFALDIDEGEKISILGASGCGKTTLLNIVAGIDKGHDHASVRIHADRIGYLFQTDRLLPWRNARNNAMLALEMLGQAKDPSYLQKLSTYFEHLGLSEAQEKYPDTLSGGMRQRVALIRLFLYDPDLLLLDEPFSGLDYSTKLMMEAEVLRFVLEKGRTMVFVTHDIDEAIAVGTRLVVLSGLPTRGITTKMVLDTPVRFNSDVTGRNPVLVRQDAKFSEYFKLVWEKLDNEAKRNIYQST